MRRLLGDRVFTGYTVGAGLSFGALFSYIAGSSFVFQDVYDVSPQVYALLFGLNGVALLGASIANHRLQERVGPVKLLRAGMLTMLVGGALVVLAVVADAGLAALVAALFVAVAGIGFVPSNGVALALEHPAPTREPRRRSSASSSSPSALLPPRCRASRARQPCRWRWA